MKSKAPLVLMEQIIMLLVFALAAAICLQAFIKADALSSASANRDKAVILAQSTAELIRSNDGDLAKAAEQLAATCEQGLLQQTYDKNWQPSAAANPAFTLQAHIMPNTAPGVGSAKVLVLDEQQQTIFELDIAWQEVTTNA